MLHLPPIDPKTETKKITEFIKATFKKAGKTTAVVAVSGGIDSATTATLTTKALGADNVHALILPSLQSTGKNTEDGLRLAEFLKIPEDQIQEINLAAAQEAIGKTLDLYQVTRTQNHLQARLGNIAARLRMIFIYDQARALDALVVGTENRSEHLLAYYTRFGDEASDLEPIKHLYKTQIYALAAHLKVPQEIIDKTPSADLWSGQTDEDELGFNYAIADPILYHHLEEDYSKTDLVNAGFSEDLVDRVLEHLSQIDYKHHVPYHL